MEIMGIRLDTVVKDNVARRCEGCLQEIEGTPWRVNILDIVSTELERRSAGGDPGDLESLIDRLPEVLSDRTRGPGAGHLPQALVPGPLEGALVEELAGMEVEAHLTNLPQVSDTWLRTSQERLVEYERKVSGLRRSLFDRIDAIQDELSRRYRSGEASVDRLIADS